MQPPKKKHLQYFKAAWFLILFLLHCPVLAINTIVINGQNHSSLGSAIGIYEDKTAKATLEQVIVPDFADHFKTSPSPSPSFGLTHSVYWLHFSLTNETDLSEDYLLEFPWPLFDDIRFYLLGDSGRLFSAISTGDLRPFSERPIRHRNFIFPIPPLSKGQTVNCYLRFKSNDAMLFSPQLWKKAAFSRNEKNNAYLLGFFFGILGVMILYNLLLAATLREKLYAYLVFMLVGYFLFELAYTGLGFEHIWPNSPYLQQIFLPLFMAICFIGFAMFTRFYLELHLRAPRIDKFLRILTAIVAVVIPFIPFVDTLSSVKILNLLILTIMAAMCATVPLLIRRSNRKAILFLIIWMPFLGMVSLLVLRNMALIPLPELFFMEHCAKIGAIIQVTFISIAVGTKMRRERDMAQQEAIRNLQKAEKQLENFILTLADTIETKDAYTGGHVLRVANYSRDIAKHLGFTDDTIKQIFLGAIVHDIGKIGIPDLTLNKQGMLTPTEYEVIKKHTTMGHRLLTKIEDIHIPSQIALSHQERWDGKGYPNGLGGENIPIEARIVTVADYWDSIITDRPYRKAMSVSTALEIMHKEREKAFDPKILDIFITHRLYLRYLSPDKLSSVTETLSPICQN